MSVEETKPEIIEFKSLSQIVFERLHLEILRNHLKPGDPLHQEELTERLGVSRTPVREAIQRLQAEGLVTFIPRRGAVVSSIPHKRIEEIYDIRGRLEAYAAGLAVDNLTPPQLSRLKQLVDEMEKLNPVDDLEATLEKNREFHYIIYSATKNETLVEMIDQLWKQIQRLRSLYLQTLNGYKESTAEHQMILDALVAKKRECVEELMRIHCEHSKVALIRILPAIENATHAKDQEADVVTREV
jgi:DNA-binding GntR family transcriptional regulator